MIIYKITNNINGKIYIGQTKFDVMLRWKQHCSSKIKVGISGAIKKYGKENFTIEVITGTNSLSEINYLEQHYIFINNSAAPNGYNLRLGGNNAPFSEETKKKMSKSAIGSGKNLGKKHTDEHRRKNSEAKKGKTSHMLGKVHSEETRNKISKSKMGTIPWNKGIKQIKEHTRKIIETKINNIDLKEKV